MKKFIVGMFAALLTVAVGLPAYAAGPEKITGELIDVACGAAKKGDASHQTCAESCAKRGQPLAVYSEAGMYIVTGKLTAENNAKLIEFMMKNVTLTGEVTKDKDGILSIAADSIVLSK